MTGLAVITVFMLFPCVMLRAAPGGQGGNDRAPTDVAAEAWRRAKRVVIFVVGVTVVLAGVALLVLPGPAFIVIPAGLAILATEFVWARRWLRRVKRNGGKLGRWILGQGGSKPAHGGTDCDAACRQQRRREG